MANTASTTRRTTLCRMRGEIKRTSIHQTYSVLVCFFSKQILTKQNIASTKYSQEFLALQVPVLRRNKAITLLLQTIHFPAAIRGKLFKLFGFASTFSREVCHLGIQKKKQMTIVLFFSLAT